MKGKGSKHIKNDDNIKIGVFCLNPMDWIFACGKRFISLDLASLSTSALLARPMDSPSIKGNNPLMFSGIFSEKETPTSGL